MVGIPLPGALSVLAGAREPNGVVRHVLKFSMVDRNPVLMQVAENRGENPNGSGYPRIDGERERKSSIVSSITHPFASNPYFVEAAARKI